GLIPTLGIHHRNKYNAYCLADDIMEPYRPYVDLIVLKIIDNGENFLELGNSIKAQLLTIASVDVQFEKSRSPLMVGVQNTTASLARCFAGTMRKIQYPMMQKADARRAGKYRLPDFGLNNAAEEPGAYEKEIE